MSDIEVTGLRELAGAFADAAKRAIPEIHLVTLEFADAICEDWRHYATMSAGEHGKYYPRDITYDASDPQGLAYEIGPEFGRKQGGMGRGFEYGSINQPPHLDAAKAVRDNEDAFALAVSQKASGLLR